MLRPLTRLAAVLLALTVSACGDLPEPFLGNPGATARRLATPMAPRLAVPVPSDTMLPDRANAMLADTLAAALQAQEVPAMAQAAQKADWRLIATAKEQGQTVVPRFVVLDPQGKDAGTVEGQPVPVEAWAAAQPATIRSVAADAAPRIAETLTGIRIARDKADPNSLYNRPPRVMVGEVTGAPGDGDAALTRQMRAHLAVLGPVVQTDPAGADFSVQGNVVMVPLPGHQQRVEIQWTVLGADGKERGKVVQLNEIPAGTLDHYWGDVAAVVATEASGGVNDVIARQTGREPGKQPETVSSRTDPGAH
jgi:hypothetical protein